MTDTPFVKARTRTTAMPARPRRAPCALDSLPPCERFVLRTMRLWMEAERRQVCLHPVLRETFARFGARDAYIGLNLLLSILTLNAPRPLRVYPRN